MYLIIILSMLGMGGNVFGQAPDTLWTRVLGTTGSSDFFESATLDLNDNVIAVGGRYSGVDPASAWIQQISPLGEEVWSRVYGNSSEDLLVAVAKSEGGYACAGLTYFPDASGDFWFLSISDNGDSVTSKAIGFGNQEICIDIVALDDGHFLLLGQSNSIDANWDGFVAKIDLNGDTLWTRFIGGQMYQSVRCAHPLSGGGVLLSGETLEGSYPNSDVFLTRLNGEGNTIWTRRFAYPQSEIPRDMALLPDSSILLCGAAVPMTGSNSSFVWKFSSNGDSLAFRTFGGPDIDEAVSILSTPDNGIAFASVTRSYGNGTDDIMLTRLDSNLDSLWSKIWFGQGYDGVRKLLISSQFQYYLIGITSSYPLNETNGIVIKTTADSLLLGPVVVTSPPFNEDIGILTTYLVEWIQLDSSASDISIQLNRHYPIGAWETITDSTENDGVYEWFVTDPLSDSCRIRICALQDTFCDVSDGNFSIVSSQGYLALVRSNVANAPLTGWNFGAVECPNAASQWFRLKNFGSESIVVFQPLEPTSSEFSRTTTCGAFFALAPNQISACSVQVVFDAASDGMYSDVLRVQTDAVNGVNGFVEFTLTGEQVSTPAAPEVVITTEGLDAHLSWSVVDTSVSGCAVSGLWYAVFYSPTSGGPFYYHRWTPDTTYTHEGVVNFSATQFYQVTAVDAPSALASSFVKGMEMGEVLGKIGKRK